MLAAAACGGAAWSDDLADGVLLLPSTLHEVSAIVAVDERTLACVQDEAGALFFVDLLGERPARAAVFGEPGDYEGLARVGEQWWVLRSDGELLRLGGGDRDLHVEARFRLQTGHRDFEGLCHDAANGCLLVLPKDRAGTGKAARHRRVVYGFDLKSLQLRAAPELEFDLQDLVERADAKGITLPKKTTPKGKVRADVGLLGSELLVVPGSTDLLLLSAVDNLLLRIDRAGQPIAAWQLDPEKLPQPEGLAVLPDGRLLVASEGAKGTPVVCVVDWR
jgi:hypothetical protein